MTQSAACSASILIGPSLIPINAIWYSNMREITSAASDAADAWRPRAPVSVHFRLLCRRRLHSPQHTVEFAIVYMNNLAQAEVRDNYMILLSVIQQLSARQSSIRRRVNYLNCCISGTECDVTFGALSFIKLHENRGCCKWSRIPHLNIVYNVTSSSGCPFRQ